MKYILMRFFLLCFFIIICLGKANAQTIKLVANQNSTDLGLRSGYGIVYNNNFYYSCFNTTNYRVAKLSGDTAIYFTNPDAGYGGYGAYFVMNGYCYIQYRNVNNKSQIAKFDGTSISLIPNPDAGTGYQGLGGYITTPVIINNIAYLAYTNAAGKYQLCTFDGTSITLIPNPDAGQYYGVPVLYNNVLYFQYQNAASKVVLAKLTGNTITTISNPDAGTGLINSYPTIFNNKLYYHYSNASGKRVIFEYNGTTSKLVANPDAGAGIGLSPTIFNNSLIYSYVNINNKVQLCKYDGTTLSLIPNVNSTDNGPNGSQIVFNGNFYCNYLDANNYGHLLKYDGNTTSLIPNFSSTDYGHTGYPYVYNNKLYFIYRSATATKTNLVYTDGISLTSVPNPDTSQYGIISTIFDFNNELLLQHKTNNVNGSPQQLARLIFPSLSLNSTGISAFIDCQNSSISNVQSFKISGKALVDNIIVNAPTGFEVSTNNNTGFSSTITLTITPGSDMADTTIYLRIKNNVAGTKSGTITITSLNATQQTLVVSGTVISSTTSTTSLSTCDSLKWNGTTYKASGVYTWKGTNAAGCDSIATLNLTVNPAPTVFNLTGGGTYCAGGAGVLVALGGSQTSVHYSVLINGVSGTKYQLGTGAALSGTLFNAGTYNMKATDTITGCTADMNGTVIVKVNQPTSSITNIVNCGSYTWHNKTYTSSGNYQDTLHGANSVGCDSITTLNLNIKPNPTVYTLFGGGSFCSGGAGVSVGLSGSQVGVHYTVYINGSITTTIIPGLGIPLTSTLQYPGTYTLKAIDSISGCSSNMNGSVTVIVNQPSRSVTNINNCDKYIWHNKVLTTSGVYHDTLKGANSNGCDSITTLNLTINPSISGNIVTPLNKGIPGVSVSLKSLTNVNNTFNNNYTFNCNTSGSSNIIHLTKNNDITKANGVTTLDIALIQAHILQKSLLNSPYKILAADVNGDASVTTLDIVYMKRLILGIDTTFTNTSTKTNRLWTFVDSSYKFVDTTNPFPYKDSISLNALTNSKYNQSFIGIKLGDVNWDWNPAVARPQINTVDAIELSYTANDVVISSDGNIHIPVKVKNFKEMLGMQFTLQFDANMLQWKGINNNMLGMELGTNHATEGSISFLWLDKENTIKTLADGTVIMDLVFVPKNSLSITNCQLSISNSVTTIAAYDKEYNLHGIVMKPSLINVNEPIVENWTVSPNPVIGGKINVSMNLKNNKTIIFRLLDNNGKVISVKQFEGMKGNNTVSFSLQNQLSKGSYYIQAIGIEGEKGKRIIVGY